MKIAILTFQFAHNYGALLQAYALKKFLQSQGYETDIAPYYPITFQQAYNNNPFAPNTPIKRRIRRLIFYKRRKKQYELFSHFQHEALELKESIWEKEVIKDYLNQHDAVVFGSDQIWNTKITGPSASLYFGDGVSTEKIAYSASIGTKTLLDEQKRLIQDNLSEFYTISVREQSTKEMFRGLIRELPEVTMDPVFLLTAEDWTNLMHRAQINVTTPYMLLYFLKDDEELLENALQYAFQHNLEILEIHPTVAKFHNGTRHLHNVGPYEFVYLIANAQCVCTNSFHATSFSVIFKKMLLHIPNAISPDRTISLLNSVGIELIKDDKTLPLYDLSHIDSRKIEQLTLDSKKYLENALLSVNAKK